MCCDCSPTWQPLTVVCVPNVLLLHCLRSPVAVAQSRRQTRSSSTSTDQEVLRCLWYLPSYSARPRKQERPTCCTMTGSSGSSAAHLATGQQGQRPADRPRDLSSHQSELVGRIVVLDTCFSINYIRIYRTLCTGEAMGGSGRWRGVTRR